MTDEELQAIEDRANAFQAGAHSLEYWQRVVGTDVPALIAEVRRLRAEFDAYYNKVESWGLQT